MLLGAAAGRRWRARRWRALPSALRFRSRPRSGARICSIRITPATPAISASGPIPSCSARVKGADLILLVGGRLGEMPSQSYTLIDIPGPRQTLVHVFPGIEELGRVYAPQLAINAAPTAFAAALEGLQPPNEIRWRGETADRACRFPGLDRQADRAAGRGQSRRDRRRFTRQASGRRGDLQRRRQFLDLGAPLPSLSSLRHPAGADLRLHGLWGAGGDRDEAARSRAHRRLLCGRRRLPDDRPGIRHRRAIRPAGHHRGGRQRHVRHHPHAPGAPLSGPRDRDRAEESDFAAYARAFGGHGATVEKTADFLPAFEAAQRSGKPAIIHLKVDPEALTPAMSLSAIRAKAQAGG